MRREMPVVPDAPPRLPEPVIRPWPGWVRALIIIAATVGLWAIIWAIF